jgi:hypothetical protein
MLKLEFMISAGNGISGYMVKLGRRGIFQNHSKLQSEDTISRVSRGTPGVER